MARLIRRTARTQQRLLLLNLGCTLLLGMSEAFLFSIVYKTLGILTRSTMPDTPGGLADNGGQNVLLWLFFILVLQLISSLCLAMGGILSGRFAARCQADVAPEIHRFILRLSYGCASKYKPGDLAHRTGMAPFAIITEIEQAARIFSDVTLSGIYLMVLMLISPWLMLMACLLAAGVALTQSSLRPRIRSASRAVQEESLVITASLTDDLHALRLLNSSAAAETATGSFHKQLQVLEMKLRRLSTVESLLMPIVQLLPVLAGLLVGLLSWKLNTGQSTLLVPALATFVLALQRLNICLIRLGQSFNQLTENQAKVELLNDLLSPEKKSFRRTGGDLFTGLKHQIQFQDVWLRYPDRQEPSLLKISFTLPRNSSLALVGSSGAGKSSIADLLIGLLDPSQGSILIDGVDLQRLNIDSWQMHLGVVSQDVLLLNNSVAANIAYGMGDAVTAAQIRDAAKAACADDFIEKLPAGYATLIGAQGQRLSGGQRQRLSLARAILRQPEILILDEATSALDSHSEARVHRAIQTFSNGRTVLTIAHRLSSIIDAEQILVMEAGRIIEQGTHAALLAADQHYAALWRSQQRSAPSRATAP
ncbi:MAG: ABC transporter ATP-binding protein [Cyanobium sp.]